MSTSGGSDHRSESTAAGYNTEIRRSQETRAMTFVARNRLLLLAAAFFFSTGGAAIKATSLTGWQVASFRSLVAAAAIALLVPSSRHNWNWRVIPVGIAYAATLISFVVATKLTTAANAIFLQSTAPLYLLLFGPLILQEPVRRADLVFMVAVAVGMSLFFLGTEPGSGTAPDPALGNRLGALSGVAWALTVGGLRWLAKTSGGDSMSTIAAGNLLAFALCLPQALPLAGAGWRDAFTIVYLGVVQIGLAYLCLTAAIRHVPAFEASTLLLAEPALNPIWAWLVHSERPGARALAGGAVILLATLGNTWWRGRSR